MVKNKTIFIVSLVALICAVYMFMLDIVNGDGALYLRTGLLVLSWIQIMLGDIF
jgi:hypothetical protein